MPVSSWGITSISCMHLLSCISIYLNYPSMSEYASFKYSSIPPSHEYEYSLRIISPTAATYLTPSALYITQYPANILRISYLTSPLERICQFEKPDNSNISIFGHLHSNQIVNLCTITFLIYNLK